MPKLTHPKPSGPPVTFYLGKSIRGQAIPDTKYPQIVPINLNGYAYEAVMGQKNTLPKEVVQVLLDSKSTAIVADVIEAERNPRRQELFNSPPTRYEYLSDYEVEIIKEEA